MKSHTCQIKIIQKKVTQDSEIDCSCQLLDTSLSKVGDSDCSCSQCLEANLQAFNELKDLQQEMQKENENRKTYRSSSRVITNRQTHQHNRNFPENDQKTKIKIKDYKSVDRMRQTRAKDSQNVHFKQNHKYSQENQQPPTSAFSRECINDYIKITQYRAREYLNQRKELQKSEQKERQRLKDMIKENLQQLKFTVKGLRQEQELIDDQVWPDYKWNHQPYHCRSKVECRKLIKYEPDLENKREEIEKINQRIKEYEQKSKKPVYQCPDRCPNHHMRTSKKKLAEIEKFIKQKAKNYQDKVQKDKAEKQQKEKIRAAKLRAIDIRCKDIVAKSRKYDPNVSRTSFHNSIDHFSTFSELRLNNLEKLQEKQSTLKVKSAMKEKGGYLEQKIYEGIDESLIPDHPPIHSKFGEENRYEERPNEESDEWCEKIVKEAKIRPPKQVKKDDKRMKAAKEQKNSSGKQVQKTEKKTKKETEKILKRQEERRKQLQMEIEKKKQQIFKEYQKRKTTTGSRKEDSKNKKIRMEYQQNLKSHKSPSSKQFSSRKEESYDPYRQVFKNQSSKDPRQLNVVGNPLIQENQYHKNVGRFKQSTIDDDRQIFMKSGASLKRKDYLKR